MQIYYKQSLWQTVCLWNTWMKDQAREGDQGGGWRMVRDRCKTRPRVTWGMATRSWYDPRNNATLWSRAINRNTSSQLKVFTRWIVLFMKSLLYAFSFYKQEIVKWFCCVYFVTLSNFVWMENYSKEIFHISSIFHLRWGLTVLSESSIWHPIHSDVPKILPRHSLCRQSQNWIKFRARLI